MPSASAEDVRGMNFSHRQLAKVRSALHREILRHLWIFMTIKWETMTTLSNLNVNQI